MQLVHTSICYNDTRSCRHRGTLYLIVRLGQTHLIHLLEADDGEVPLRKLRCCVLIRRLVQPQLRQASAKRSLHLPRIAAVLAFLWQFH